MPGFPVILAGSIWAFGESLFAARLVLATIGALGCVGIYWLGERLVNQRVGLIAGSLAAVSPIFVGFSAIELTETAFRGGAGVWIDTAREGETPHLQPLSRGRGS